MSKLVYFLRPVGQLGPIKIGCSKLPALRLETLTTWSPVRLELICSVPGSHKDEHTLHGMFARHHVHGEWFGASKELLALIDYCEAHGELPALPKVVKFPKVRHVGHRGRAAGKREPGDLSPEKMEMARIMRGQYESGLSGPAIAAEHGKTLQTVYRYIRAAGGTIGYNGTKHTATGVLDDARAADMRARYQSGETLQAIGDSYGITRERVRQILRKTGVPSLGRRPEHMRQPHELTPAEIEAAKLYDAGVPPKEVKARTGVSYAHLAAARKRLGIECKGTGHWLRRPDDAELTARTCALYLEGKTAPEIVALIPELKFPATVYRYLKKGGVKPRTKKGNFRHRDTESVAA